VLGHLESGEAACSAWFRFRLKITVGNSAASPNGPMLPWLGGAEAGVHQSRIAIKCGRP